MSQGGPKPEEHDSVDIDSEAEVKELPPSPPLLEPLCNVLPRPAFGEVVSASPGDSDHDSIGWSLHYSSRIIVCTSEPHRRCPCGNLSYVEAAQV